MSHHRPDQARVTVPQLQAWREAGRRIVMTTAYDAVDAGLVEGLVDVVLVGDSVGNVCLGFDNTLPVSVAMLNHHLEAVTRTGPSALVVADMPYLSFHLSVEDTLRNAGGFMQRGAGAVKLEGGSNRLPMVRALVDAEIPVMGHLGLTPQSVNRMGGFKVQGRAASEADRMVEDALALEEAGCFAIVIEGVPSTLGERITGALRIPTIGIGAGPACSGQVLVLQDMLGLLPGKKAKFVRTYADGYGTLRDAVGRYAEDVRSGAFPSAAEGYAGAKA